VERLLRRRCQNQPPNAQDLLRIAREALLDLKFRQQSRIYFYQRVEDNAFHLRALTEKWIGFSEDDVKNTTVKKNKQKLVIRSNI